jgi:hypothetical protein
VTPEASAQVEKLHRTGAALWVLLLLFQAIPARQCQRQTVRCGSIRGVSQTKALLDLDIFYRYS